MLKTTGAEADVTFLGVAAGDATSVIRMQTGRQPADFYSPDTFNYKVLDVSADGKTLTVTSYGINSTVQNGFVEYDPANNPEQELFSFQIKRHPWRISRRRPYREIAIGLLIRHSDLARGHIGSCPEVCIGLADWNFSGSRQKDRIFNIHEAVRQRKSEFLSPWRNRARP